MTVRIFILILFCMILGKFFVELDDFVPRVNATNSTSDSSEDTADTDHTQLEQGESSQPLRIEYLCKNLGEEGEYIPITLGEFYSFSPYSIDSREYEFESLLEATMEKDIDQVHVCENQLEVGEASRVMSNESDPTSVLKSSVDDVSAPRHSNTLMDEISLCLNFLVQAFDDYTMNTIKPTTTPSLTYTELID